MSELIQRMPAVVQTIRLSDLVDIAILSIVIYKLLWICLLYTSPSPRDRG